MARKSLILKADGSVFEFGMAIINALLALGFDADLCVRYFLRMGTHGYDSQALRGKVARAIVSGVPFPIVYNESFDLGILLERMRFFKFELIRDLVLSEVG